MTWHRVYVEQTHTMVYEVDPDTWGEPDATQQRTAELFAEDADRWEHYRNSSLSVRYEGDNVVTDGDEIVELESEPNAWDHVVTFRSQYKRASANPQGSAQ